jgi:hypothetical protein
VRHGTEQGAWAHERSQTGHRSREARGSTSYRCFDRRVAGAGGVFLLRVDRLRRRRLPISVASQSYQGLAGFPAARTDGRSAGPAEFLYGGRGSAWPCGAIRFCYRCCRPRPFDPGRRFRSGWRLPVGVANRTSLGLDEARHALIIEHERAVSCRPQQQRPRTSLLRGYHQDRYGVIVSRRKQARHRSI